MNEIRQQKLQIIHYYEGNAGTQWRFHHSEVHTLFDELIHKPWGHPAWQPLMDVFETNDRFIIYIDLPGIEPVDLHISISGSRMLVEGCCRPTRPSDDAALLVHERPCGDFQREIDFHEPIAAADPERQYHQGVLIITVKKDKGD